MGLFKNYLTKLMEFPNLNLLFNLFRSLRTLRLMRGRFQQARCTWMRDLLLSWKSRVHRHPWRRQATLLKVQGGLHLHSTILWLEENTLPFGSLLQLQSHSNCVLVNITNVVLHNSEIVENAYLILAKKPLWIGQASMLAVLFLLATQFTASLVMKGYFHLC